MFTVLLTSGNAGAQIPAAETERFEVSSIKRSAPSSVGGGFDAPPGKFIAQNTTPLQLIAMAYQINALRVVGPDWMSRDRFDVVAATPLAWQPGRAATMVRQLLADRFGLIVHRESRELPAFVLTRVRDGTTGPNLRQTTRDCSPPPSSSSCSTRTLPGSVVVSGAR
jgi:uncharacterized protein (TIGR03435 family)